MNTADTITIAEITVYNNIAINNLQPRNNPGLRALLSIRNFSVALQKDYDQLLQNEKELYELNKAALLIIEQHGTVTLQQNWKKLVVDINMATTALNDALNTAKEKIEKKEVASEPVLWNEVSLQLKVLKTKFRETVITGYDILPEITHPQWKKEFEQMEKSVVQSIISNVENCRVLMQMIERYTPDVLNKITKIIVDQIPLEFTYEEAATYQKDYYKSLVNFKQEFKEEKNLWDKFLDILAGGTHQPPSERVMLERWIEGKKGELE